MRGDWYRCEQIRPTTVDLAARGADLPPRRKHVFGILETMASLERAWLSMARHAAYVVASVLSFLSACLLNPKVFDLIGRVMDA